MSGITHPVQYLNLQLALSHAAASVEMFDKKNEGTISEDELKKILTNKRGDPLSEDEIKAMYKGNPPISGGKVDYKAFAKLITTGANDE